MAGPTATAPVLTWSPLLFPPWNTALLPAAFYPVAALRSLPGFLDSMKLPQSQRTTSTGAGFRICNLLELDNDKKQHAKKRKSSSSIDDPVTLHRTRDHDADEADDEDDSGAADTACPDGSLTRRSGTTLSQEDTSSNPDLHGCSVINSDDDSRPEARGPDGGRGRMGSAASRGQDERTSPSAASGDEGGGKPSFGLRTTTSLAEDLHARFGYTGLHPSAHLSHLPSHPHHHHTHHQHNHHHQHHPTHLHHPHHTLASTPPGHALFGGRSWPYDSCNTLNGKCIIVIFGNWKTFKKRI
ncbi:homeobox protein vnd-like [Anopheles funestus]|uniref:homeobox protein vnd-like n=1 Tax=Anopheles funestus TaxID=62324 RepID=UPI0020C5F81C|nr:homeobox protein vnd-like [Anopheles funestus]